MEHPIVNEAKKLERAKNLLALAEQNLLAAQKEIETQTSARDEALKELRALLEGKD